MSTHNICFLGEIRKMSVLFGWKKCLTWRYGPRKLFSYFIYENMVWVLAHKKNLFEAELGLCYWGGVKVSCVLCHRGVQLILAYSWARPAILVAGVGREVMFLFLLFLHFQSCSSFFSVPLFLLSLLSLFSLSLGDDTK